MILRYILNVAMWLIVVTVSLIVFYCLYVADLGGFVPMVILIEMCIALRLTKPRE